MSQAPAEAIVLPRPNPGPEPWSGEGGPSGAGLGLTVAFALLAAFGFWLRRRGRRSATPAAKGAATDDSPQARLIALCEQVRGTLSTRLDSELRARTTEEIAADPAIQGLLGAERLDRLIELLRAGDRLKFASQNDMEAVVARLGEYTEWASSLASLPRATREVNTRTRRPPGGRSGRRSPRSAPPRS